MINIVNSQISNCGFTDMVTSETKDCDEFRVGFDRYGQQSLKSNRRSNRTKGLSVVHYKVSDTTRISAPYKEAAPFVNYNKK